MSEQTVVTPPFRRKRRDFAAEGAAFERRDKISRGIDPDAQVSQAAAEKPAPPATSEKQPEQAPISGNYEDLLGEYDPKMRPPRVRQQKPAPGADNSGAKPEVTEEKHEGSADTQQPPASATVDAPPAGGPDSEPVAPATGAESSLQPAGGSPG